ncbi:MAG: hypothetical protein LBP76_04645 [Treponema sp.]|jgi:hypothetical protein|nr:hypothetical protein [Treponema sp.]
MSYRQQFHDSIEVSGVVSRSVGPSQNSQTVSISYSQTVPLNITIDVITDPFDNSIDRCNGSLDMLTGAVAGMHSAQCGAIRQTAAEVSQSLINGFFGTIRTELSQQIQALNSAIQADEGLILEQGKAVSSQKNVMETDYNRIGSRYVGIFRDLDDECHKRIYALDKPAFMLSEKVLKKIIGEAGLNASAKSLITIQEESSAKTMLVISSLARKVHDVLETLRNYITQEKRFSSLTDSFMENEKIEEKKTFLMPVIFVEQDGLERDASEYAEFLPESVPPDKRKEIGGKVRSVCGDDSVSSWAPVSEEEKELLNREFGALSESAFAESDGNTERRIYNTLMGLWQNSSLFTVSRKNH